MVIIIICTFPKHRIVISDVIYDGALYRQNSSLNVCDHMMHYNSILLSYCNLCIFELKNSINIDKLGLFTIF